MMRTPGLAGALPCRTATSGSALAGEPCPLFQIGEEFADHLDAVREQLAEQLSCGHMSGLAGWELLRDVAGQR